MEGFDFIQNLIVMLLNKWKHEIFYNISLSRINKLNLVFVRKHIWYESLRDTI